MTETVTVLCYHYSKDYEESLVEILFSFASEDVGLKKFTWDMFFAAFRQAGKHNSFFPTYDKIIAEVNSIKERLRYQPLPESHQLTEGQPVSKEKVREYMAKLRKTMGKMSMGVKKNNGSI